MLLCVTCSKYRYIRSGRLCYIINDEMSNISTSEASARMIASSFYFTYHVCCIFWWKSHLFKVNFDALCTILQEFCIYVSTLCVLRTVPPKNTAYQKGDFTLKAHTRTKQQAEWVMWNEFFFNYCSRKHTMLCIYGHFFFLFIQYNYA